MSQYAREVWSSSNGLPKGKINGITQTSDGYLWIGTEHGTKRFDGASFISLTRRSRNQTGPVMMREWVLSY